jgi:hypothetical protein
VCPRSELASAIIAEQLMRMGTAIGELLSLAVARSYASVTASLTCSICGSSPVDTSDGAVASSNGRLSYMESLVMRSLLVLDFWAAYDRWNKSSSHAPIALGGFWHVERHAQKGRLGPDEQDPTAAEGLRLARRPRGPQHRRFVATRRGPGGAGGPDRLHTVVTSGWAPTTSARSALEKNFGFRPRAAPAHCWADLGLTICLRRDFTEGTAFRQPSRDYLAALGRDCRASAFAGRSSEDRLIFVAA